MFPQFPETKSEHIHKYTIESGEAKIIADYAHISVFAAFRLDVITYYETLRDAVIYNNMQTEEGQNRLDDAWILEQKRPDRNSLRKMLGKE